MWAIHIHGDTNAYCLDQPFDHSKNLWRLHAPGDFKYVDVVVIKVFPTDVYDVPRKLYREIR
jgi:hypothetical protein